MRLRGIFLVAMSVLALVTGCGTRTLSESPEEAYPAHFREIRARILRPRCEICHTKIVLYQEIIGDLVVPGNPDSSELFKEINSGSMPRYGGKLSDDEISAIKNWILGGAKND